MSAGYVNGLLAMTADDASSDLKVGIEIRADPTRGGGAGRERLRSALLGRKVDDRDPHPQNVGSGRQTDDVPRPMPT